MMQVRQAALALIVRAIEGQRAQYRAIDERGLLREGDGADEHRDIGLIVGDVLATTRPEWLVSALLGVLLEVAPELVDDRERFDAIQALLLSEAELEAGL